MASKYGTSSPDVIQADDGDLNAQLFGYAAGDYIQGFSDDNDTLIGGPGDDSLYGGSGNDTLIGNDGNDTLYGGDGDDIYNGGEGNDTYIDAGYGNDTYYYSAGDTISEDINSSGLDLVILDPSISSWDLNNPQNQITGIEAYQLSSAGGALTGTDGSDYLIGSAGNDTLTGNAEADLLIGNDGDDVLDGGDGGDTLDAGNGNDTLSGGAGGDTLHGGSGNDTLNGGNDSDALYGDEGDDILVGGTGNDLLYGGSGSNTMTGGNNNDDYFVDSTTTAIIEESQFTNPLAGYIDRVFVTTDQYNLSNGYTAPDNVEEVYGWTNSDILLIGNSNNSINSLRGGDGNDILLGSTGMDALSGGAGNDTLDAGAGYGELSGSIGNDTYIIKKSDTIAGGRPVSDGFYANVASIEDQGSVDSDSAPEQNTLILQGFQSNEVLFQRDVNHLYITDLDGHTIANVYNFFEVQSALNSAGEPVQVAPNSIQNIVFDNASFVYDFQDPAASSAFNNLMATQAAPTGMQLSGTGSDETFNGGNNNDIISGDAGNDFLYGGGGGDTLSGGDGNDLLDGGLDISPSGNAVAYADGLSGGNGDDVYVFGRGYGKDGIFESGDGNDTLRLQGLNPEDVTLSEVNLYLFGVLAIRSLEVKINDTGETINVALQFPSYNTTTGEPVPATVNGIEHIEFANGVVWNTQDIESAANGNPPDYEPPVQPATATEFNDVLTGTPLDDTEFPANDPAIQQHVINGLGGDDVISMLAGDDIAIGGSGNDTLNGGDGNDILIGSDFDLSTMQFVQTAGTETLAGNAGNDVYFVINDTTTIVEAADEGTDAVYENVESYTAGENVENVYSAELDPAVATANGIETEPYGALLANGSGAAVAVQIAGNALDNILVGNALDNQLSGGDGNDSLFGQAGNDQLDGGTGADLLVGGIGDDIYVVDDAGDVVAEAAGEGYDIVQSSVTFNASTSAVEDIELTGTGNVDATGNDLANNIIGNGGNNRLDGGAGIDVMIGGAGNDTYVVDSTFDAVIENPASGTDLVESSITYTLGSNLENLTLTGTANINGTGNAGNNTITGNAGNNTLFGGSGNDTLIGGAGNDVFVVNGGDTVVENPGEGIDRIESSATFSLASQPSLANVENLTLTGASNINGTGNALDNTIIGNNGNNTLNGGAGADTLIGGGGNDTYVYGAGDSIVESVGGGVDLVQSAVAVTLAANVDNLTLTGSTSVNGTGNNLDNILTGNTGSNLLTGGAGNDTLSGGNGTDSLLGGSGNDTYILNRGNGADTIVENDSTAGNSDLAQFGNSGTAINAEQLWFSQSGNNLTVSVVGTSDSFTFTNWYAGNAQHVEQFRDSDGSVLSDTQVQNLVNAMASFTAPPAGTTTLDASYQPVLDTIAANWA